MLGCFFGRQLLVIGVRGAVVVLWFLGRLGSGNPRASRALEVVVSYDLLRVARVGLEPNATASPPNDPVQDPDFSNAAAVGAQDLVRDLVRVE